MISSALSCIRAVASCFRSLAGPPPIRDIALGAVGCLALLSLAVVPAVADPPRPTHAAVEACLANWDHDAEPDGWKARVVLLDKHSHPTPRSAHATFELVPRMPSLDRTRYVDVPVKPLRWWKKLEFNESGVAEVQLPKRGGEPVASWAGLQRETRFGRRPHLGNRVGRGVFDDLDGQAGSARPRWAVLRVRVSVAGVGVLESVAPLAFDEPLLVDSGWPYR